MAMGLLEVRLGLLVVRLDGCAGAVVVLGQLLAHGGHGGLGSRRRWWCSGSKEDGWAV